MILTPPQVAALAAAYPEWDTAWVVWQVFDAGTGNGESSGRSDALNPAGPYRGLMQIWDANATRFGYQPADMYDPAKNIAAAHRLYLEQGIGAWPSSRLYKPQAQAQKETTMPDGICPFATQVNGVTSFQSGNVDRVGFCDHTAGGFYGTLADAGYWNRAGLSVHFGISRKGEICQVTNIFDTAYAQGLLGPTQSWPPYLQMQAETKTSNPNNWLISTEHEDAETVNGQTHFVPGSQWTEAQYAADLRVKQWCVAEVKRVTGRDLMRFGIDSLAGHHMFDSVNRAECPGKFWREEYRGRLWGDLSGAVSKPTGDTPMSNLNADGSQRIVSEGNFIVTYNNNIAVQRLGSTDGKFAGRMSKNFGGNWLWFRALDDHGNLVPPYWSPVEGD